MLVRPKVIYLASRSPAVAPTDFPARWLEHGSLAMSLPIWRNMWKYAQCDPQTVDDTEPGCDAIGLVWYRSWSALESLAQNPELRQPLLVDEKLTFSGYIRDCALLSEERILSEGPETEHKLFLFLTDGFDAMITRILSSGAVRTVRNDRAANGYTATSTVNFPVVLEAWYGKREEAVEAYRTLAALPDAPRIIAARERQLYGPRPD